MTNKELVRWLLFFAAVTVLFILLVVKLVNGSALVGVLVDLGITVVWGVTWFKEKHKLYLFLTILYVFITLWDVVRLVH